MISSGSGTDGWWSVVAQVGDDGCEDGAVGCEDGAVGCKDGAVGCEDGAVGWAAAGTGARAGSSERAGSDADTGVVSGREGEAIEDGGGDDGGEEGGDGGDVGWGGDGGDGGVGLCGGEGWDSIEVGAIVHSDSGGGDGNMKGCGDEGGCKSRDGGVRRRLVLPSPSLNSSASHCLFLVLLAGGEEGGGSLAEGSRSALGSGSAGCSAEVEGRSQAVDAVVVGGGQAAAVTDGHR